MRQFELKYIELVFCRSDFILDRTKIQLSCKEFFTVYFVQWEISIIDLNSDLLL